MKATEFDKRFDDGEDIDDALDFAGARRPNLESKRVNQDVDCARLESPGDRGTKL